MIAHARPDVQRLPHREDGAVMVREPSSLKNQRTLELSMELKPALLQFMWVRNWLKGLQEAQ